MVNTNQQLKYGWINGGKSSFPVPIGNGEVINAKSGRFMKWDGSGRVEVMGNGDAAIAGHLESEPITAADNTSEGKYSGNLIDDTDAVFRIPLRYDNSTYTQNYASTLVGKTYDLVVINGIQYANLTDSDEDVIVVIGGEAASSATANDGYVDVRMNRVLITYTSG